MDRGDLVPDSVILGIMREALGQAGRTRAASMLDGVVRTVPQAEGLAPRAGRARAASSTSCCCSTIDDEELVARLSARTVCENCQTPYTGRAPGSTVCASAAASWCAARTTSRMRFARGCRCISEQTAPVIEWYRARARDAALRGQSAARVVTVDAIGAVDDVTARVIDSVGEMIQLKSPREIEMMAEGGKILADTVAMLRGARGARNVRRSTSIRWPRSSSGRTTERYRPSRACTGFPVTICTSINEEIVHGIPSRKRVLREGDSCPSTLAWATRASSPIRAATVAVGEVDKESERLLAVTSRGAGRRYRGCDDGQPHRRHRRGDSAGGGGGRFQRGARAGGARDRDRVPRGAAGAELRQAEALDEAGARAHDRDRADGERGCGEDADDARPVDRS